MIIGIAGTHRVGKTILTEAFVAARPEYRLEPEPYVALIEEWGEDLDDDLSVEAFHRQLKHHRDRVVAAAIERNVVFDRCAVDLLAYIQAAARDLGGGEFPEDAIMHAQQALEGLDLIVHLPLRLSRGASIDPEDASYRRRVDFHLSGILEDDSLGLFSSGGAPEILELGGPTEGRLKGLLTYVERRERDATHKG